MIQRTLAVGDVHGCIDELRDLLNVCNYDPSSDRLVFLGDYMDRGPDPAGVVRFIRQLAEKGSVVALLGNHDEKVARWFRRVAEEKATGRKNPMGPPTPKQRPQWEALTEDEVRWLGSLPVTHEPLPGWIAVHAGFEAVPFDQQRSDKLIRCRWVYPETGKMASLNKDNLDQPEGTVWWMDMWKGPQNVVYGHAVHSLKRPRTDRPVEGVSCWGIDTGACYGGHLTALCLETLEVFQAPARAVYAELKRELID